MAGDAVKVVGEGRSADDLESWRPLKKKPLVFAVSEVGSH